MGGRLHTLQFLPWGVGEAKCNGRSLLQPWEEAIFSPIPGPFSWIPPLLLPQLHITSSALQEENLEIVPTEKSQRGLGDKNLFPIAPKQVRLPGRGRHNSLPFP